MKNTKRIRLGVLLLAGVLGLPLLSLDAPATTVTNGLAVHLKFDGNLLDSTANKLNGTNVALGTVDTNGVTFAPGYLGQAVHILVTVDGTTNNYVTLGYPALLHFGSDATTNTSDFSVAMWLKIASSAADEPFISNKNWDSSGDLGWVISNESDGTRVQLTDNVNPKWNMVGHAGPQLEDKTWHHLTVTFQRTNLASTYVDGVLLNTFSIAPASGSTVGSLETDGQTNPPRGATVPGPDWAINLGEDGTGLYATNNGAALDCLMDDVGIWRRALTASEVQEIYTKATVSGQTLDQEPVVASVLPGNYAMPAGSVNTNQPGFRVRPYQTAATEGGTIAWAEGQQAGLYGPNIADLSGADAGGYYTVTNVINFNISPGGTVDSFPGADSFPGIGAANVNFSEQILTYIEFPAPGEYLLGVNSDDGFGVTASVLNPKDLSTAVTLGKFDGNRGSGDTIFQVAVPVAGIYPIRLLYWQAGGGANLSFFSVVSDSTSTNNVLINDLSTPGALKAYATAKVAPPYATAFNFSPAGFSFIIQDDISAFATNSLKVTLNGSTVTNTVIAKSGTASTITYSASTLFAPGSSNVVSVKFSDDATPAHNLSYVFTFVVPAYTAVPPTAALPSSAVDTAQRGFTLRISQIDSTVAGVMAANIAHAEAQLAGLLIDPTTGAPYVNTASPGPQPDGSYVITNINFSYDLNAEQGSFSTANGYPDSSFPGLNGGDSANIAGEIIGYLDLQPGFYTFGVDATDGFRVTAGANPHDAFGTMVGLFDYRAITTETRFGLAVQTAGIYPVRLVWFRVAKGSDNSGDASLEFYSIDAQGNKTLVNDTKPGAVKSYWKRTGTYGSFVSYAGPSSFVSPFGSSADVGFTNASLVISDGTSNKVSASSIVWTVDGTVVSTNGTSTNGQTVLAYNPKGLQLPRMIHAATVAWSDAGAGGARHTNSWNFHLLRNYVLPAPVFSEDFESTPAGPDPSVPAGWVQTNFTGPQVAGNDPGNLNSDFYLGWVVVDKSFNISKDFGVSSYTPQILNGLQFDEATNALLVNHYIRAESDSRQNGPPGQIQYLYTKPYDLTGKTGIVIAFDSAYEQNQDSLAALEYTLDGTNYYPVLYWVQGDFDSQAPADIYRDGLGNIDVTKTMMTTYGDVARYTDPVSNQLVGGYYGFFIKAPITQALAPYIEGRYNDDGNESKRIELYRIPLADNQKNVVFRFVQAGTSSWYWAIDNWGVYSVPSLAVQPGLGSLTASLVSGQLNVSWTGSGTLQSAPDVTGPWTNVPSPSNPFKVTPTVGHQFYRLHQ